MAPTFLAGKVEFLVAMLLVATVVSLATRRTRVPYTVALVILGVGAQAAGFLPKVGLTPGLVLTVFLPPLLFEAAWNLDIRTLRIVWKPVAFLAILGVAVAVLAIGAAVHLAGGLSWPAALLLGAALSATDPVSVVALFKEVPVPGRLAVTIEGESLFNDGTSVAIYQVLLAGVATGKLSGLTLGGQFVLLALGGLALGVLIGGLASMSLSFIDDHLTGVMLTTVVAYGGFLLGARLGVSPVLTVVAAGLVAGNVAKGQLRMPRAPGPRRLRLRFKGLKTVSREISVAIDSFWEYAAFVVNSLLFLLVGLEFVAGPVFQRAAPFFWALVGMQGARLLSIGALFAVPGARPRSREVPVLYWGGLRGALSLAMALGLPLTIPGRDTVIAVAYGCVLFTLVVQGLSMPWLVSRVFRPPVRS